MPIQIPSAGMVKGASPTIANAPDAPRGFFAGRGISVPRNRTTARASAFGGGQGAEAVNQAIAGVMSQYEEELIRVQRLENKTTVAEKATEGLTRLAELSNSITSDGRNKPSEWFRMLQKNAPDIESALLKDDLPPEVVRDIRSNFAKQYSTMTIKLVESGATETVRRARVAVDAGIQQKQRIGDFKGAADDMRSAVADGIYPEADAKNRLLDLQADVNRVEIEDLIKTDPKVAFGKLNVKMEGTGNWEYWRYLDDTIRRQLTSQAERAAVSLDASNLDLFMDRVASDDKPTPHQIREFAMSNDLVSNQWVAEVEKTYYGRNPRVVDLMVEEEFRKRIKNYDRNQDDYSKNWIRLKNIIRATFRDEQQERLLDELNKKSSYEAEIKSKVEDAGFDYIETEFKTGSFGISKAPILEGNEENFPAEVAAYKEALRIKREVRLDYLRKLYASNDSAPTTATQAMEIARDAARPYIQSKLIKITPGEDSEDKVDPTEPDDGLFPPGSKGE